MNNRIDDGLEHDGYSAEEISYKELDNLFNKAINTLNTKETAIDNVLKICSEVSQDSDTNFLLDKFKEIEQILRGNGTIPF